jgi:TRAP-type C4-dicarboxylate transport system substrate-binding protein
MEFSEITPGLQRKALDGVRSNIMVLTGIKVFSVAQNITLANDSMIPVVAMASKRFMDRLPADLRDAVLEVGRDMERHMLQVAKDYNTSAVEEWSKNGKIFHLNEGDQKMLMENGARIAEEVLGTREDTKELFRILKAVAEKHNK